MHRLLPKPLSDLWTGWEASEAVAASESEKAAASARDEQVASVLASLAATSVKSSADKPSQVEQQLVAVERKTDSHHRNAGNTSQLIRKWESQCRSPQFAAMQLQRQALPAWSKRADIIAAFTSVESRVFLVQASAALDQLIIHKYLRNHDACLQNALS